MAENRMELFIETLTGTAFELSCSPLETIVSIKAKIQYSEGIPVSQQHLIWKSQELNDDLCLQDYCITDGATLKLVLGMRGGPINTRQVSDSKKLKDLADYVERRSETGGSGGRPFTVLVFHDGDKVHMYTLMERGECTVSPLSGTISETSSVASIKHVEELDQELIRENEVTKEKITRLQEQIRSLNINRSRKASCSVSRVKNFNADHHDERPNKEFHLPPLQRIDSLCSQESQFMQKENKNDTRSIEKSYFARFAPDVGSKCPSSDSEHKSEDMAFENKSIEDKTSDDRIAALNSVLNSLNCTPDKERTAQKSLSCSSFLPNIDPMQRNCIVQRKLDVSPHAQNAQTVGANFSSSCVNSLVKCDPSRKKNLPVTSSQALSCQRFIDLDHWIQNRPKTTPESVCKSVSQEDVVFKGKSIIRDDRRKRRVKQSFKNPLSVSLSSGEKSSMMMQAFSNHQEMPYDISPSVTSKNKTNYSHNHSKTGIGTLVANLKALSSYSPDALTQESTISKVRQKASPPNKEGTRPPSGRKLPLIKAKKKSYKRCTLCSKRTGLATSYTCRCGKNFCASHRYAEVHQCTYDYKTEGRRILQLNNPVVAASKLPKI